MKKNTLSFTLGLIASIFCLGFGLLFFWVGGLIAALAGIGGEDTALIYVVQILGAVCFFGAIAGIVGAILSQKKKLSGGIILTVATIMCGSLLIYVLVNVISSNPGIFRIILLVAPLILFILSTIFAFLNSVKSKNEKPIANLDNISIKNEENVLENENSVEKLENNSLKNENDN